MEEGSTFMTLLLRHNAEPYRGATPTQRPFPEDARFSCANPPCHVFAIGLPPGSVGRPGHANSARFAPGPGQLCIPFRSAVTYVLAHVARPQRGQKSWALSICSSCLHICGCCCLAITRRLTKGAPHDPRNCKTPGYSRSRTTQRNPIWLMPVSTCCACRAAGR